ncbi:MAG: hypothetical protein NZ572_01905 [Thermoflexus sp.]|nr:hypothetical protein [Thermoflexus sp.]
MVQHEDIYEAEILERCLGRLEQGADLETCLREFPEATSLLPLLKAALWLQKGQEVSLRPPALQRMIRQGRLYASRAKARPAVSSMTFRWAGALVALLGLILVALSVVSAAEASLPDEPLYPVKRAVEGLLVATMPPEERALWLAERRWEEFETATTQGRWLPALAEESLQYLEEAARSPGGESSPRRARLRALYERQGTILEQALWVAPPETRSELARAQQEWRRLTRFLGLPEGGIPPFPEETPAAFPESTARPERTPPGQERRETPRSERTPPGLERRETPWPQRTPPGQERQPTPRIPPGQQDGGRGPGQTPPGRR